MTPAILGIGGYGYLIIGLTLLGLLGVTVFLIVIGRNRNTGSKGST